MPQPVFFAPCPRGLEKILAEEIAGLGAHRVRAARAGVSFEGPLEIGYRTCLWSRIASRVLLRLDSFEANDAQGLYEAVRDMPWEDHIFASGTLAVDFVGTGAGVTHTKFGALKVKDAIVDRLRDLWGERPNVDVVSPDVRVNVRVRSSDVVVSLDLAGDALHRRGYREPGVQVAAPLKENLAAGVLCLAGWPKMAEAGAAFVDPMCGSGTLAIEAATIACDIAPGARRRRWGFAGWARHDCDAWEKLVDEAAEREERGRERGVPVSASDVDAEAVRIARDCVTRAGLEDVVEVSCRDAAAAKPPAGAASGLLAVNPPYGERIGARKSEASALRGDEGALRAIGKLLGGAFSAWTAAVLAPEKADLKLLGRAAKSRYQLYNGRIPVVLAVLEPAEG